MGRTAGSKQLFWRLTGIVAGFGIAARIVAEAMIRGELYQSLKKEFLVLHKMGGAHLMNRSERIFVYSVDACSIAGWVLLAAAVLLLSAHFIRRALAAPEMSRQ